VHGGEDLAATLGVGHAYAHDRGAVPALDARQPAGRDLRLRGVVRVHVEERLGRMLRKSGDVAGACHRVPLVADTAGVEHQAVGAHLGGCPERRRHEAGAAVEMGKPPVGDEPRAGRAVDAHRPLCWFERVVGSVLDGGEAAEVERAFAVILTRTENIISISNSTIAHNANFLENQQPISSSSARGTKRPCL
jgi:hypothetical protein